VAVFRTTGSSGDACDDGWAAVWLLHGGEAAEADGAAPAVAESVDAPGGIGVDGVGAAAWADGRGAETYAAVAPPAPATAERPMMARSTRPAPASATRATGFAAGEPTTRDAMRDRVSREAGDIVFGSWRV
jgi:hypothetical protein